MTEYVKQFEHHLKRAIEAENQKRVLEKRLNRVTQLKRCMSVISFKQCLVFIGIVSLIMTLLSLAVKV